MDDILVFLKNHIYFSVFSETERKEFAKILNTTVFEKDNVIFRKGDIGDQFYIVKDGLVRIFISDKDTEETIALMKQGDIFGELSLYDAQPRSAHASALTTTTILAITMKNLEGLRIKNPEVVSKLFQIMLKIISKRMRLTTMKLYGQF